MLALRTLIGACECAGRRPKADMLSLAQNIRQAEKARTIVSVRYSAFRVDRLGQELY